MWGHICASEAVCSNLFVLSWERARRCILVSDVSDVLIEGAVAYISLKVCVAYTKVKRSAYAAIVGCFWNRYNHWRRTGGGWGG